MFGFVSKKRYEEVVREKMNLKALADRFCNSVYELEDYVEAINAKLKENNTKERELRTKVAIRDAEIKGLKERLEMNKSSVEKVVREELITELNNIKTDMLIGMRSRSKGFNQLYYVSIKKLVTEFMMFLESKISGEDSLNG